MHDVVLLFKPPNVMSTTTTSSFGRLVAESLVAVHNRNLAPLRIADDSPAASIIDVLPESILENKDRLLGVRIDRDNVGPLLVELFNCFDESTSGDNNNNDDDDDDNDDNDDDGETGLPSLSSLARFVERADTTSDVIFTGNVDRGMRELYDYFCGEDVARRSLDARRLRVYESCVAPLARLISGLDDNDEDDDDDFSSSRSISKLSTSYQGA